MLFRSGLPGKSFGQWRKNRIANSAQKRTFKGLVALSEGNWWQAQRLLSQAAPSAAQPLINYLGAAKAAHEQGNTEHTNNYFAKARLAAPQAEVSIALQEAEVETDRGNNEKAFTILKRLHSLAPKHTGILRDLAQLHQSQQDWDGLIALLPKLRKNKVLADEEIAKIEANCYAQMLKKVGQQLPVESSQEARVKTLTKGWKALPNSLNQTSSMMATYAQVLIEAGTPDEAEKFLRNQIKRSWDTDLIDLYGTIKTTESIRPYNQVLHWLKKQPKHAALELCAARLAMINEKWQEAVTHFEASIAQQPSAQAYRELSKLLESLGQHDKALEMSQLAMSLTDDNSPVIPLPALQQSSSADSQTNDGVELSKNATVAN